MTDLPQTPPRTGPVPSRNGMIGNGLAVASTMAWAAGFPAAEVLLDTWHPVVVTAGRMFLAVLVLLPLWLALDGWRALAGARWARGLAVGGLAFGGGAIAIVAGQALTDPVTVAIIVSASPLAGAVIERILDGRRLTRGFALGLAASVLGGIVATGGVMPAGFGWGAVCAVASCFLFTWGSHVTVRDFPALSPLGRTTITLSGGLVFATLAATLSLAAGWVALPPDLLEPTSLGLLAIYAIAALAISQVLWIAAVGRLGVAVASMHINVSPFYVMLILVALGQAWSWPQAIGAGIVALGVLLAQR